MNTSTEKFRFLGTEGAASFPPTDAREKLQNKGGSSIQWSASTTSNWLTVSPNSGTLAAGASTELTVSVDPAVAGSLVKGLYNAKIVISNVATGAVDSRIDASLRIGEKALSQ